MAKSKKETAPETEVQAEETEEVKSEEVKDEKEEKIAELEKELAAAKEAHIRTLAEYDNYRKRSTREKEAAFGDSKAQSLAEILPVLDNFDRALQTTVPDAVGV